MTQILVGVLELNCGKTFGRQVRTTKKEGRLLYGIRHSYKDIPPIKAPYDIRNQQRIGTCSRYVKDKYVIFQWSRDQTDNTNQTFLERPEVQILDIIGDVDDVLAFSSYRAYLVGFKLASSWAKELLQYRNKEKRDAIMNQSLEVAGMNSGILEKQMRTIFTIDPVGCKDMDDGVGIKRIGSDDDEVYEISVAITHVPSFLVATGLSSEQLITTLTNTCSLYMNERVVNMIPKHFAEDLCSLTEGQTKPAMVMTILWDGVVKRVKNTSLVITENVLVTRNYNYESSELLGNPDYTKLIQCVDDMSKSYRSFDACPTINDSHDVVAYLMTFMNYHVMEFMEKHDIPCVYRVNRTRNDVVLPSGLENIRRKINNYAGEYCDIQTVKQYRKQYKDQEERGCLTVWTHVTSPMRRLADLLNMISLSLYSSDQRYKSLITFRDHYLLQVGRLSEEYKLSRRLSLDCDLFSFVKNASEDGSLFSEIYSGLIMECDDTTGDCVVYVEKLSRFFNCKTDMRAKLFQQVVCKVVVFDEGHLISDKVKLVIVEN